MTDDEHIGVHGNQIIDGVKQGFAFGRGGTPDVQIDDVGRKTLGGYFEGGAGTRRIFEEEIENTLAAQKRDLLDVAVGNFEETRGGVEDLYQNFARQTVG